MHAYTELGVPVTVVASRDRVLPYEDADAALVLEEAFAERGVRLVKTLGHNRSPAPAMVCWSPWPTGAPSRAATP